MKKIAVVLLLLCLICLAGCGGETTQNNEPDEQDVTEAVSGDSEILRHDPEGSVTVRIENGAATLIFDPEKWDVPIETLDIAIQDLSGRVIDACIGKIAAFIPYTEEFGLPTVVLLMEDGCLEWLYADPTIAEPHAFNQLPWLNDIVSLAYEAETEGIGEMTIFATDNKGLRYDVRIPCFLTNVFAGEWICEISDDYCIFLSLTEDGGASLEKGVYDGDRSEFYKGKYTLTLAENNPEGWRPGLLSLELWDEGTLDKSNPDFSSPPDFSGQYFIDADWDVWTLFISEGDTFEDGVMQYPFWQPAMHTGY